MSFATAFPSGVMRNASCVAVTIIVMMGIAGATPLDDYVAAPDPNYTYSLDSAIPGAGYTGEVYYLASQKWREAPAEVDRDLWEHWLVLIVPDSVTSTKALLFISGGNNGDPAPTSVNSELAGIAAATGSIVAELRMIPNQRIKFADETDPRYVANGRTEDELCAYVWDKYKTTGDPTWLPRLPMTKASVRAMDTIQAEHTSVDGFVVAGGSKRGWTTWTTGIVDARVEAIVPLVIDLLNIEQSFRHHWDVYGFWAPAVQDYVDMGVMDWMHTQTFRDMLAIVGPYSYLDRPNMTMPKYIVNSTGDQFFLPDSSQYYWDALKGEKGLRYVPNTDHGLNSQAWQDFAAYYEAILNGTPRPEFSWTKQPDGALHVQTVTAPTQVLLWQASNTNARDFRLDTIGAAWTSSALSDQGGGLYIGSVPVPTDGWTAFMVELTFDSGGAYPFKFTTEVSVVPDTLPYRKPGGWGTIEAAGEGSDAITLVKLGGNRYEMGYWYGRLLADQIAPCWIDMYHAAPYTEAQFDAAIDAMWRSEYFDTAAWEDELRGVADGCVDAGHPEITYRLLQKMNMIPDMSESGCGLFALWGAATVNGDLYQMRNLDWTMDAGIQEYPVVAVYNPADGKRHAVIGFAGLIAAAGGGINAHGLAFSQIMGHFCDPETLDGIPFPVLMRDILYHDGYLGEALSRIQNATRTNQYHYCIGDPGVFDFGYPQARLLFTSNTRFDEYADNESVTGHPCVSPDPFHAALDDCIYWKRHDGGGNENLYDAINARYGSIGDAEAIEIAKADGVSGTLLSIVYHNSAQELWVAFAEGLDPAHNQQYVPFSMEGSYGIGGSAYRTSVGSGSEEIPVVVVSGTSYEMGYHYGRLMKVETQAFIPQFLDNVQQEDPAMFSNANLDAAWETSAPYTDERYKQELLGLAVGAEIDYLTLRRAHAVNLLAPYACSGVAAWDTATVDGHLYQTRDLDWDMGAGAHDYPAIVVYMPEAGNAHVNVVFAGVVGSHTGMSVAGIALSEMGDSPGGESPYDLNGNHFMPMFREILYDADSLSEALDILTNTQRIKRYHYVFGDGRNDLAGAKIKAHAPELPPDDLIIWHDNDPADEFYPEVLVDVVYNDEGRGAFPTLSGNHGSLDADMMIDLANQIATHGSNVMNVVYDATDLEFWVAFADGSVEAYLQPYVHVDLFGLDGDGDQIADLEEGYADPDEDGVPNYLDDDSDGDGIGDALEGLGDPDGDSVPNYLDDDSDGDGIPDETEGSDDPDEDTVPNFLDDDSDGDTIPDATEGLDDPDGDTIPNFLDLDSDGDGASDEVESGMGTDPYDAGDNPMPASRAQSLAVLAICMLALASGKLGQYHSQRGG